ncbi:MAG: hypothetical protein NC087_04620 [Anaeroplasma bactoclasticum]|nr:hypothetical protein [Anaeroplasma bactoclasticum]
MDKYKLLEAELLLYNISVIDYDLKECDSFTVKDKDKYYIVLNKNKKYLNIEKFWIIEHELEHIKNGTVYKASSGDQLIKEKEEITNDALIKKLGLDKKYIISMINDVSIEEFSQKLELNNNIIDNIKNYIDRELLHIYSNAFKIERRLKKMKNRALLLCLKNGIETAEEYALKIGTSTKVALEILKEEAVTIPHEVVLRNCEIFNVTQEYFLCLTE